MDSLDVLLPSLGESHLAVNLQSLILVGHKETVEAGLEFLIIFAST